VSLFLSGALVAGYVVAALFFARFWRDTRDRLFAMFSAAFILLALQRTALSLTTEHPLLEPALYGLRLLAFLVIIAAVVDKNRGGKAG